MCAADALENHSRAIAQRFLRTAVVVDDEAHMSADQPEKLKVPDRRTGGLRKGGETAGGQDSKHTLDAGLVMAAFAKLGIICGVVAPAAAALETMRSADIVILDWLLEDRKPDRALELIRQLLTGAAADRNALRLLAIYTGEAQLEDIRKTVFAELKQQGLEPKENGTAPEIPYRHGCVVVYAKSEVNLAAPLKGRSIAEDSLPEKLVNDFAAMTAGLLPAIALTSLTAVREGAHKVLDRFSTRLDPAFLAHRACLATPDDAQGQIVHHVAEELRGLMDNVIAETSPAGVKAVEGWIRRDGRHRFTFNSRELDMDQTIALAKNGIEAENILSKTQQKEAFRHLSTYFAGQDATGLDHELAWIMSFRTVYDAPPPTLWLGSVVTWNRDGKTQHLLCMRPRCDCVRLNEGEESVFFFLPLDDPRQGLDQIVVRVGDRFERLGIARDLERWVLCRFKPSASGAVIATGSEPDGDFQFTDTGGTEYTWRGELKADYAQRIAQTFGGTLSRVAVDESEWLRRYQKRG